MLRFFLGLSIVVLTLLSFGYFGRVGVILTRTSAPGTAPAFRGTDISLDAGRVTCWIDTNPAPALPNAVAGRAVKWKPWRPRSPDIKHAVAGFDSHPLPVLGGRLYLFAFPIWCIALPFLIAPALCLRRRLKKRPEPAGFAVVEIAG
jgi:hypothetical protein